MDRSSRESESSRLSSSLLRPQSSSTAEHVEWLELTRHHQQQNCLMGAYRSRTSSSRSESRLQLEASNQLVLEQHSHWTIEMCSHGEQDEHHIQINTKFRSIGRELRQISDQFEKLYTNCHDRPANQVDGRTSQKRRPFMVLWRVLYDFIFTCWCW